MNFYINATVLMVRGWSGIPFYVYNLLSTMVEQAPEHTFHLHLDSWYPEPRLDPLLAHANVRSYPYTHRLRAAVGLRLNIVRTHSEALYLISTLNDAHMGVPVTCPSAALIFDCGRFLLPECNGITDVAAYKAQAGKHMRARNRIVTISHTVKNEVIELFGVDPDRIVVAPAAVPEIDWSQPTERPVALPANQPFFLMVNMGRPYKNWQDVLHGFSIYLSTHPADKETLLVHIGDLRSEAEMLNSTIAADPVLRDRVLCLGYVSDAERHYMYSNARMLVFPSRYEGFGLPTLEAMSYDLPVIVSDIPVMKEIVADAGLRVPLDTPEALADAMGRLHTDAELRTRLIALGRERVKAYSWDDSASTTLEMLISMRDRK